MFALAIFLNVLGLIGIFDGLFFFARRDIIEPAVNVQYPNLNCSRLAVLEIVAGIGLLVAPYMV